MILTEHRKRSNKRSILTYMYLNNVHFRFIFLICLIAGWHSTAKTQNRIKWAQSGVLSSSKQSNEKYYLIYFFYNDCKWCKHLETTTFTDDYTARFINQKFHAVKIDAVENGKITFNGDDYTGVKVGKYEFNELAVQMLNGKMSFPAIVILDEKMQKIGVHQNYYNVDDFQMILAYYVGGYHKTTLFKYYSNNYCKDSHFYNLVSDR